MSQDRDTEARSDYHFTREELLDFVMNEAARRAEAAIQTRSDRTVKKLALLLSVLAFLGLGGIFGIVKYAAESEARRAIGAAVPALVQDTVRPMLDREIKQIEQQLANELLLSQFIAAVDALNAEAEDKSFTDAARDEVMRRFHDVADVPNIQERPQFRKYLRDVVGHFTAASQESQLNEIDEGANTVTHSDRLTLLSMTMHYGQAIAGSPYSLDHLTEEMRRLESYLTAVESRKYPEIALLWRVLVETKRARLQKTETLDKLVRRLSDLDDEDKIAFLHWVETYSDPTNWQERATQEGEEIQNLIKALRRLYPQLGGPGEQENPPDEG